MTASTKYEQLLKHIRELGHLESSVALLDWDAETYMPSAGIEIRSEQIATLSRMSHEKMTEPVLGELLAELDGNTDDDDAATNVREMKRTYDRAVKVPGRLVEELARTSTRAKETWAQARKERKFELFEKDLSRLIDLRREYADAIGYEEKRYDALLDEYEPGMRASQVTAVFDSLRGPLSEFVQQIADAPQRPDPSVLHRHYPEATQKLWCRQMAEVIGFDFKCGRIDISTHPFCSGTGPQDVRLTTRYEEDFFNAATFGTLHEAGHGLYEQGLPTEHLFTPRGEATSLGIHESQSRMWENMIGRSLPFWKRYYAQCQVAFPDAIGDVPLEQFYGAINTVEPSFIRVEADEVTYNLHIILRFEIESDLIDGTLAVKDLPAAWNQKMTDLMGITPAHDADGCLQDVHWSFGGFGYFPTYALGNLYAAQFFEQVRKDIPDLDQQTESGKFDDLLGWLRTNIHQYGSRYRAAELAERVTGKPLTAEPFLNYIRAKFSPIYGLA